MSDLAQLVPLARKVSDVACDPGVSEAGRNAAREIEQLMVPRLVLAVAEHLLEEKTR